MPANSNYQVGQRDEVQPNPIRAYWGDKIADSYERRVAKIPREELTLTRCLSALHESLNETPSNFYPTPGPTCSHDCHLDGDWLVD